MKRVLCHIVYSQYVDEQPNTMHNSWVHAQNARHDVKSSNQHHLKFAKVYRVGY